MVRRNYNSMDLVFSVSVREDDMFAEEVTSEEVKDLLTETDNGKALDRESYSASLEVYRNGDSFFYRLKVQDHDEQDWGKKTGGETDTRHTANTRTYEGEVPEDTAVYQEASEAAEIPFR